MKHHNYHRYNSFVSDLMRGLFVTVFILIVLFYISVANTLGQGFSLKMDFLKNTNTVHNTQKNGEQQLTKSKKKVSTVAFVE